MWLPRPSCDVLVGGRVSGILRPPLWICSACTDIGGLRGSPCIARARTLGDRRTARATLETKGQHSSRETGLLPRFTPTSHACWTRGPCAPQGEDSLLPLPSPRCPPSILPSQTLRTVSSVYSSSSLEGRDLQAKEPVHAVLKGAEGRPPPLFLLRRRRFSCVPSKLSPQPPMRVELAGPPRLTTEKRPHSPPLHDIPPRHFLFPDPKNTNSASKPPVPPFPETSQCFPSLDDFLLLARQVPEVGLTRSPGPGRHQPTPAWKGAEGVSPPVPRGLACSQSHQAQREDSSSEGRAPDLGEYQPTSAWEGQKASLPPVRCGFLL